MSDQDNIFGGNPAPQSEPASSSAQPSQLDTILDEIRNERGERKYADVPTALAALKASQEYIPTLQQQLEEQNRALAEVKTELQKQSSLQDVVQEFTQSRQEQQATTPEGLDRDAAAELFRNMYSETQQQEARQKNTKAVVDNLPQAVGCDCEFR